MISVEAKLAKRKARKPYPLSWDEEDLVFAELLEDPHRQMAIFKVNAGTREQEVCRLRWDWEIAVPELNTSVFVVPGDFGGRRELSGVKNGEDRVIMMNQAARAVIETRRGIHPEFVFTWRRPSKRPDAG